MTDGPRTPTGPLAPDTAPGAPATDGTLPLGVDSIGEGFKGSTVLKTVGDDKISSVTPETPLPDNATETEKELADKIEEEKE